jgi:membrane protease YdiL (CAAX protease family)
MTDTALPSRRRPFVELTDFKFRLWPILLAAVLMQGILVPCREAARWIYKSNIDLFQHQAWVFMGLAMLLQASAGVIGILVMQRLLPQSDGHLRWPPGRTYLLPAVGIGLAMALIMLVADYWPQLLSHTAPEANYPGSAAGWLSMMLLAGVNEEPIFRGLLVGMLTVLVPGRLRIGRLDLPVAAYIVAVMFGLAHYDSFLHQPLHLAIAQQLYAFAFGLTYVWLMERTRSLLAPMVAHGLSDAVEVGAVMFLAAAWS